MPRSRRPGFDRGDTGREILFCLVFLAAAVYAAILFGGPHYNHYVLQGRMADIARQVTYSDQQIRNKVMEEVRDLGMSIRPEQVDVERTPQHHLLIKIAWTDDVELFGYYITSYDFRIVAGGDPKL